MLEFGLLLLSVMLVGCTEKIPNKVNVLKVEVTENTLFVYTNFEPSGNELYWKIKDFSAHRLICDDYHGYKIEDWVQEVKPNFIKTQVQICQNNDNRDCKPMAIQKPVDLQCQFFFIYA